MRCQRRRRFMIVVRSITELNLCVGSWGWKKKKLRLIVVEDLIGYGWKWLGIKMAVAVSGWGWEWLWLYHGVWKLELCMVVSGMTVSVCDWTFGWWVCERLWVVGHVNGASLSGCEWLSGWTCSDCGWLWVAEPMSDASVRVTVSG